MRKFLLFLFLVSTMPVALAIVWCRVAWAMSIEVENDMHAALKSYHEQD